MPRKAGLTKKEKTFCDAYVFENMSATKAYLKAYDCEYTTANAQGYKMLLKPHIKEYITELQKIAFDSACITAEKVALQLADIAFVERDDTAMFASSAQLKALDLLQKQLSLQHQNIKADVTTDFVINIVDEGENENV